MKKNLTEIIFILDRSGSMAVLEAVCGGFLRKESKMDSQLFFREGNGFPC